MAEPFYSWACRRCLAGWWGAVVPKECPKCHGTVHVTGNGYQMSLRDES